MFSSDTHFNDVKTSQGIIHILTKFDNQQTCKYIFINNVIVTGYMTSVGVQLHGCHFAARPTFPNCGVGTAHS